MENTDLFAEKNRSGEYSLPPLAACMRPKTLDEIVGQKHILGPGKLLRRVIEADRLTNLIFYGPPGCGKTTLAEIIARVTKCRFERTSGVLSNVSTLRKLCEGAKLFQERQSTVLFIDEIHRFNKSQQDTLLPYVEDGTVTLIGATTHNPNVFVNSPLTSRSLVFELQPLNEEDIIELINRALTDKTNGLGNLKATITDEAAAFLSVICDGDARRALTALEVAVRSTPPSGKKKSVIITAEIMQDCVQRKMVLYDKNEDGHYDTISAFIKSVRGSDPHAAIYWLAKMIEAGEDPRFIARRLIILASEDIGNADPRALNLAVSAMQAVAFIGMPEARITLAQATTYLATAPKSNASYVAVNDAMADIKSGRTMDVPEHLKNMHVKSQGKNLDDAEYQYPHNFKDTVVQQDYIPVNKEYYRPTNRGYEDTIGKRMQRFKKGGQ
ncbi:MAG: replication-associated recombination protein A [Kiritimatiellae bacterium]|jgi:putative ATPase|nr:replication-associated recombination protein A [Kiritimatiellia bacterium]